MVDPDPTTVMGGPQTADQLLRVGSTLIALADHLAALDADGIAALGGRIIGRAAGRPPAEVSAITDRAGALHTIGVVVGQAGELPELRLPERANRQQRRARGSKRPRR